MNRAWHLAKTPTAGWPDRSLFDLRTHNIPHPDAGQFLTRTIYLSMDPYQWGRRRSGTEPVGSVCHGRSVAQVVLSRSSDYEEGDFVFNTNGWQEYGLTGTGIDSFGYMHPRHLDPSKAPISTAIGVLGMLGLTAYSGMCLQCNPQSGETAVVSAASGGVGQVASQLAKIFGSRTVGIAGTPEKCRFLQEELGLDSAVCHQSSDYPDQLRAACPAGIDIYFENVGGHVFDAVLPLLNRNSRITRCGLISQYGNTEGIDPSSAWLRQGAPYFESQSVQLHGLFVGDFVRDHQREFLDRMSVWLSEGSVVYREHFWYGIESAPDAFDSMLHGRNFGKTIVQVSEDTSTTDDS